MRVDAAAAAARQDRAPPGDALLDFAALARSMGACVPENFSVLNVGGVNVELASGTGALSPLSKPTLDAERGLAVRTITESGDARRLEVVQIAFLNATSTAHAGRTVTKLVFRDADPNANDSLARVITDNGAATDRLSAFTAKAAGGDPLFANTRFVLFGYIERPFHVSAIGVRDVKAPPAPMLGREAGLGFAARRRENGSDF